jgi:phage tail sheath protein FI
MAFQISPGVNLSEVDLTTVVPSVLTTAGATAGTFKWGPAEKIVLIDSEINLVKTFGTPDSNSTVSFYTAANFLSYGNNLSVVRAVGANSKNADANTTVANVQVKNEDDFEETYLSVNNSNNYGAFMARYPGALGNSLKVEVFDSSNTTLFNAWTFKSYFTAAPGTSDYVDAVGGQNDEMHIIVIDQNGLFTGAAGTVLETFPFVSKASDATINGKTNYYKQLIFNDSKYIYATDPVDYANTVATWGTTSSGKTFARAVSVGGNISVTFAGGTDDVPTSGNMESAYDLFTNKETTDISLVVTGNASSQLQQYVIDEIVTVRRDCVAFISPPSTAVINQSGSETSNIESWLNDLGRSSSYVVADSGWKYQYDKYNNTYVWVPLNGDIAGLCVYTDTIKDPWFSPAGFNRGAIKNSIKLAWNPNKTQRDVIYSSGVNPVVSFPGQGTVLFGDKTLQSKPSAFDRINVRRLFLVLEKAISNAAQYSLFELNDEFTRAQFVSLVTPFLRDVQGRRGITEFKVVCDKTNNTPQVIDSNRFVGDIYVKPARSTNYIQLNFVAVATGVDFTTIVGAA